MPDDQRTKPDPNTSELLDNLKRLLDSAQDYAEISGNLDRSGTNLVLHFNSEAGRGPIKGDIGLARNVAELIAQYSV